MKKRGTTLFLIITSAAILSLLVIICLFAFAFPWEDDEYETETTVSSVSEKPETRPPETTETHVTNTPTPTETAAPSETVMTSETTGSDIDHVKEVYIYSVWYDAIESNPAYYDSIESKNASALKGVFYFSEPLSVDLQARLYKDNSLYMTRVISLKDNVTAEADFSASFEESERFMTGEYYIELLLDGEPIATTTVMRVK